MPQKEWFIIKKKIQKKTCLKVKASCRVKTSLNDGGGGGAGVNAKMTPSFPFPNGFKYSLEIKKQRK